MSTVAVNVDTGWGVESAVATNEKTLESRAFVNVVPLFGKLHDLHPDCWCAPQVDCGADVLIHNVMQ